MGDEDGVTASSVELAVGFVLTETSLSEPPAASGSGLLALAKRACRGAVSFGLRGLSAASGARLMGAYVTTGPSQWHRSKTVRRQFDAY